jgi:hypothetical protein
MDFALDVDGEESIVGAGCTLEGLSSRLPIRELVKTLEVKLEKPSHQFVLCKSKEERERLGPLSSTLEQLGIHEWTSIYVRAPEGTVFPANITFPFQSGVGCFPLVLNVSRCNLW